MKRLWLAAVLVGSGMLLGHVGRPVLADNQLPCAPIPNGNGAGTCTVTMKNQPPQTMLVAPAPCPDGSQVPGGILTITVMNSVFHITFVANPQTGQPLFWATGTIEGTLTLVAGAVTYTGHFTQWFGDANNLRNGVQHDTFNVTATGSDGSHISFHVVDHASVSASGVPVTFTDMHC